MIEARAIRQSSCSRGPGKFSAASHQINYGCQAMPSSTHLTMWVFLLTNFVPPNAQANFDGTMSPARELFYRVVQLRSPRHVEMFSGQIFTLNFSPRFSDCTKAAINCGINSRSFRLTTSTGECM